MKLLNNDRVEIVKVCKQGGMLPFLHEKQHMKETVPCNLKLWSVASAN